MRSPRDLGRGLEIGFDDDAEVLACASDAVPEIGVLGGRDVDGFAAGEHDAHAPHRVDAHAVKALESAVAATETGS